MQEQSLVKGKKARTRLKIMHTAKGLFEEKGLNQVTFNDIALALDLSRTTVFNHFSSTEELMIALCEQEVIDIEVHCEEKGVKGIPLVKELFNKLLEDTAYYPILTTKLTNSSILGERQYKPITRIEKLIEENLNFEKDKECSLQERRQNSKELTVLLMGAYYGLINHYHLNNKNFKVEELQGAFKDLLNIVLGGHRNE